MEATDEAFYTSYQTPGENMEIVKKAKELLKELRASQDSPDALEMGGNGKGTATCYKVQARMCSGCSPKKIPGTESWLFDGEFLTDSRWKTIHFPKGPVGVPASRLDTEYARHGFLSYTAAQALRWWFLAEQTGIGGVETRLVEYKFEYSYSAEPVRAVALIDPEQREDILPDWGKPKTEA